MLTFFKRFKIGCQSPYAKKTGEQCNVALGSGEKEMNYIYSFSILPGDLFVRPAELMSESIYYTLPTRCYHGEHKRRQPSHPVALCAIHAKYA